MQLPLNITLRNDTTLSSFVAGENVEILNWLNKIISGEEEFVYIWGEAGTGRSHLLQAACNAMEEKNKTSVYLPLREYDQLSHEMLQGLETLDLVCLDDVDAVIGLREWEVAIMTLFNELRENQSGLVVSASGPADSVGFQLKDLSSRLMWGFVYHMKPLSDDDKLSALIQRAEERGLAMSSQVGQYITRHYPRDITQLFDGLDRLDTASLAHQRKLTIPFVKEVLG